ncbi:MAG: site-specific integrase [Acidobacteria bacterium]|nr:site-specific integrase [Acidobacteriota bacterium]
MLREPAKPPPADQAGEHKTRAGLSMTDAMRTSVSDGTDAVYERGWRRFAAYCDEIEIDPLAATPEDVGNFLVKMGSGPEPEDARGPAERPLGVGTLRIVLAGINRRYHEAGRAPPTRDGRVTSVLQGLRRLSGGPPRQVKALREYEIAQMLSHCEMLAAQESFRHIATRDSAMIAIGFAAALRRSEICRLEFGDLQFLDKAGVPVGMFLHIRRSKTDQFGEGQKIPIPEGKSLRPVARLREWLALSGTDSGPVFQTMRRGGVLLGRALHPSDIGRVVKQYVSAIGLDPSDYAGHSLRSGFVTSAAAHGARMEKIMEVTRHTSPRMVMRYIREAEAFEDHAGAAFL